MKYIKEYETLHALNTNYGTRSMIYLKAISLVIDYLSPKSILDFGCGKGVLIDKIAQKYPNIQCYGYDPAVEEIKVLTTNNVDLVICTDVLEHIPESELDDALANISKLSKNAFFMIDHALAGATLPNGENAHCTVKPYEWYYDLLKNYYETPYPLNGAKPEHSAMITFSPSIDFLEKYDAIISIKKSKNLAPDKKTKKISRFIGKIICLFIPKKKNRKHFREKYFCTK